MFRHHSENTRYLSAEEKQHSQAKCVLMISANSKISGLGLLGSVAYTQASFRISDATGYQRQPHGAVESTRTKEMWALGKNRLDLDRDLEWPQAIWLKCFKIHPFSPEFSIFPFNVWSLSLVVYPSLAHLRLIHWFLYWSPISLVDTFKNGISIY